MRHPFLLSVELIETLWNVNAKKLGQIAGGVFELIETLWNVNVFQNFFRKLLHHELIETLWNVNIAI